jgi:LacI family transcriptional regulator
MTRPTIRDLAQAAGVSVSTVNRVLASAENVREDTMRDVRDAAERIGFYGLGSIQSNVAARRPKHRFGLLLLQPARSFYRTLAAAFESVAQQIDGHDVDLVIEFSPDLAPETIASRLHALGQSCDAVGVVAPFHPLVASAVEELEQRGIPVFALISQISPTGQVRYVGLDNWKVGRTAAWAISNICKTPGKVGLLVGSHRFRCQEMNESGFRSYFREHAPEFDVLGAVSTFESSSVSQEVMEKMLQEHPDLAALYVAGGGITGVIAALKNSGKTGKVVTVAHDLMDVTRAGLLEHSVHLVISHPVERFAREAISNMIRAAHSPGDARSQTSILPFEIYTSENI